MTKGVPTISKARDAFKTGEVLGSGVYRSVHWTPGDFWCYKIPIGVLDSEREPDMVGVQEWIDESNLATQVEYFNQRRIIKDWVENVDNPLKKKVRIPEMVLLRGTMNGYKVKVMAAERVVEGKNPSDPAVRKRFSDRYSLQDMHGGNMILDSDGYTVPIDLGEDTWSWSGVETPEGLTLKDYKRSLRGIF